MVAEYKSKEELYATLDSMSARLLEDEAFKRRIAHADVSIGFIVSDLGAEYSLHFHRGEFSGSAGGAEETTVGVTLSSETLDKLLSGKISGESAYFSGAIRLRGGEWAAQSLIGYFGSILTAYKAVAD